MNTSSAEVKWLNSHYKRCKWNRLDCSDLLPFPFCWKSLHVSVYFYSEQTVHFSPVCKCTIKELVASNHRMWMKAKSGQLFTCLPLILRWLRLLQQCPHSHRHPGGWRGNKSSACQTAFCPNPFMQKLHPAGMKQCWDVWKHEVSRLRYI